MPQTKDDVRSAMLDKREAALAALQEQVRKDGEHLYEEANAKVAARVAQLDQREAALSPKEVSLATRESEVAEREKSLLTREQASTILQLDQRSRRQELDEQSASIATRLGLVIEREGQHQRLRQVDLDVIDQKRKLLQEELTNRETRLLESQQAIAFRETTSQTREKALAEKLAKADALLKTAEERDAVSKALAAQVSATQIQREQALTDLGDRVGKREGALDDREQKLASREQVVAQQEHDLNRLSKGLNKAKLDIETKEAQVEKRERLVAAIAKKKEVAEELAKLE